jgi:hypothetical protein
MHHLDPPGRSRPAPGRAPGRALLTGRHQLRNQFATNLTGRAGHQNQTRQVVLLGSQSGGHAAVNPDIRPGDEARVRRGQECDDAGVFFVGAESPQRNTFGHQCFELVQVRRQQAELHKRGRCRSDPDSPN